MTASNDTEVKPDRVTQLEREGDIAADYLEALLDIADLDGDIDMDVEGDRAMVAIVGAKLTQLVGPNGKVLDALQELTRLAVTQQTGDRSRLMLDVAGHRAARREQAMLMAESLFDESEEPPPAISVFDPDFHEGVVGIVAGRLNKQIADDLGISIKTVEAHRANIMEKLGASNRTDAVRKYQAWDAALF